MSPEAILTFVRAYRLAVVATVSDEGLPEAALMGIVDVAVRITWMRYSDYNAGGDGIVEHVC